MKKKLMCLFIILITGCSVFKTTDQSIMRKDCTKDSNTVIIISKLLLNHQDVQEILSSYSNGSDTFYVRNPFDTSAVIDTYFSNKCFTAEEHVFFFYDYVELFAYRIMTWLEYEEIIIERKRIHAKFKIIVKYPQDKPTSEKILKAVFECVNKEIRIISLDL